MDFADVRIADMSSIPPRLSKDAVTAAAGPYVMSADTDVESAAVI
jgi:hypothetical protein